MPRLPATVAVAALGVWLAACTDWGPGPDVTGATPNAVTIRYDAGTVDAAKADDAARAYCAGYGKRAKLRSRFGNTPSMTYADYSCLATRAD